MKFDRVFTKGIEDFDILTAFEWEERTVVSSCGTERKVTVPKQWSQTAASILSGKYLRKAGVPESTVGVRENGVPERFQRRVRYSSLTPMGAETHAEQAFHRMAGAWTYWGLKHGHFGEDDAIVFYDEMMYMLAAQMAAPASPQWFNTGLYWAYGIEGDAAGLWSFEYDGSAGDPVHTFEECHAYVRPQAHACFLQSVQDDLVGPGGIMDLVKNEARVFKFGSGSGSNFSKLRGENEPLSGGGFASGLMSWLGIGDVSGGAIKSGGTVRRAAKMVQVNLDHPDILAFVRWKRVEEQKVAALVAGSKLCANFVNELYARMRAGLPTDAVVNNALALGVPENVVQHAIDSLEKSVPWDFDTYDTNFLHEGYRTVSGQNSNNSVRITNAGMLTMLNDGPWPLYERTELVKAEKEGRKPESDKIIPGGDLWDEICEAAWHCADPGIQFDTTQNEWNTCAADGIIQKCNPCCLTGEMLADTSEGKIRLDTLAKMYENGEPLPYVFAYDREGKFPVMRKIKRAWQSGKTRRLVKVVTDKGVEITCTPEHRFLTYDGGYVRADRLSVGTSLRKIARHTNTKRSNRIMISDRNAGTASGTQYQSLWMWEQVNGVVPEGHEAHHKNGDATDDRVGNLGLIEKIDHRKLHSVADGNPRWIGATDELLLSVWDRLQRNNRFGRPATISRWNLAVRKMGLLGRVPLGKYTETEAIMGKSWPEFCEYMTSLREGANDKVVKVEVVRSEESVPVYDLEVEGVHNFAVSHRDVKGEATIVVHNSEYIFLDDTGCNLFAMNIVKFQDNDSDLMAEKWAHASRLLTLALDITVGMAGYPTEAIARGSGKYRTIGLGYCNLGAAVMRRGLAYDSEQARDWAGAVTALMHFSSGAASAEMAEELGAFPRWEANRVHMARVIENHNACLYQSMEFVDLSKEPRRLTGDWQQNSIFSLARHYASLCTAAAYKTGFRNAQWTLLMPTGTVGLLMDADTTGVEPDFALVKFKKLVGGGSFRLVNESVGPALTKLGYSTQQVINVNAYLVGTPSMLSSVPHGFSHWLGTDQKFRDEFYEKVRGAVDVRSCLTERHVAEINYTEDQWNEVNDFLCGHMTLEGAPHLKLEHLSVFDCANKCGRTGNRHISVEGHLLMMAAVQPFLSGGISKTINLPAEATLDDVKECYRRSWELVLKATAMYRDGSKLSQPLSGAVRRKEPPIEQVREDLKAMGISTDAAFDRVKKLVDEKRHIPVDQPLARGQRRKLPNRRPGETVKLRIAGHTLYLRPSYYPDDGEIGEIFIDLNKEGSSLRSWANAVAMAVSIGLQHGVPLDAFADSFIGVRFEPNGVVTGHEDIKMATSVLDLIFRELQHSAAKRAIAPEQIKEENTRVSKEAWGQVLGINGDSWSADWGKSPMHGAAVEAASKSLAADSREAFSKGAFPGEEVKNEIKEARLKGYEGEQCGKCGKFTMVRTGPCLTCDTCGEPSGGCG